jgi:hypothetical protein
VNNAVEFTRVNTKVELTEMGLQCLWKTSSCLVEASDSRALLLGAWEGEKQESSSQCCGKLSSANHLRSVVVSIDVAVLP